MSDEAAPLLKTLAPRLTALDTALRAWLGEQKRFAVPADAGAELGRLADDLGRQSEALAAEKPLIVILLMGGTGVGKSSLLNALAGAPVAQASFTRPTTRDPVVYFHRSVHASRLDPALSLCRLAQHDRPALEQKILVDTPDLDSNDTENREKLKELLPIADVVLYVGSQEKYHDEMGWELFREQRKRRAFAFVLNKWDRCSDSGAGLRPDNDLLRDLRAEGFDSPRLFRTCAQLWIDAAGATPTGLPAGEQFAELRAWLEGGLTRLEVEAVKARGVGRIVARLGELLQSVRPPDLSAEAEKVRVTWGRLLVDEAAEEADALAGTLEPYQNEVEHHFSARGQGQFRGLMAAYLRAANRLAYFGSGLRSKVPGVDQIARGKTSADWNLAAFAQSAARVARDRVLGARLSALGDRLLVEADHKGFPLALLNGPTLDAARAGWDDRVAGALHDALAELEREASAPTGVRQLTRGGVTLLGNAAPGVVLVGSIVWVFWLYFVEQVPPTLGHLLLPIYSTVAALVLLHVLILAVLPTRWAAIRDEFRRRLERKLRAELERSFGPLPGEVARGVADERRRAEYLAAEAATVADFLREREETARVSELYGK